ncbi:hypothetical protein ACFVXG_23280 [Kitasatospora sp. NPDC058162]|uniref:hypothetical protein n=1 Tax=Kitasatospora sp. NPDC058162 TaxID=3346362 RepID=UPI0036D769B2
MTDDAPEFAVCTTFHFGAPDGETWGFTSETFAARLTEQWPATRYEECGSLPGWGRQLRFGVPAGEFAFDGSFAPERQSLYLADLPVVAAAAFVLWLQEVIPAGARIRFSSNDAFEVGIERDYWIPAAATYEQIVAVLTDHLAEVEAEE